MQHLKFITEIYELPKDLRASEVSQIGRWDNVFQFNWYRAGRLFICRNVPSNLALTIIMALKDEIKKRKNPEERIEFWECDNEYGVFDNMIYERLLSERSK